MKPTCEQRENRSAAFSIMAIVVLPLLILLALALGGCATDGSTQSLAPVCEALGPVIKYNPRNKDSDYHAGPKLAPQIAYQNRVRVNLSCPS